MYCPCSISVLCSGSSEKDKLPEVRTLFSGCNHVPYLDLPLPVACPLKTLLVALSDINESFYLLLLAHIFNLFRQIVPQDLGITKLKVPRETSHSGQL